MEVTPLRSLSGSVAIVTGAGRGFGREICKALAAEGVRIVGAGLPRGVEMLSSLVDEIRAEGGSAEWRPVDVRSPLECSRLVEWTAAEMGGLHILVNSAGLGHWVPVESTSDDQWLETVEVNLNGTFFMSRAAIVPMKRAGRGHIVNIASVLGRRGAPNFSAYCASKAGVMAFTESLSKEVKEHGIQVSLVSPGTADTEFRRGHEGRPQTRDLTDMDRMLRAADVASAVLWALKSSRHVAAVQVTLEPLG
jgi:3-oxoacyl-[acyl-carrier protein] reductase